MERQKDKLMKLAKEEGYKDGYCRAEWPLELDGYDRRVRRAYADGYARGSQDAEKVTRAYCWAL